ncbi:MAG: alpha/beta hydrolase [Deltaproteobacteria bacterium]|nr:alpha/beta hydrolase [Deltaproteobacteria bacterium]
MIEPRHATFQSRHATSPDGLRIGYQVTEAPFAGAPAVVLAGRLGGQPRAWQAQVAYLGDRFRFVSWTYRGTLRSAEPKPASPESYATARQLADLQAVLAAESIGELALVGWGTGARVALAAWRAMAPRIRCLVLINPLGPSLPPGFVLPRIAAWAAAWVGGRGRGQNLAVAAARAAGRDVALAAWLVRIGAISPRLDPAALEVLRAEIAEVDPVVLLRTAHALSLDGEPQSLGAVNAPALLLAGGRDPIAPAAVAQQLARSLPRAQIVVVPRAQHHLCLEYPDLVNLEIERFFSHVGLC